MRQVLVIEHTADGGLGHFTQWLRDGGVEPVVVRPYLGEELPAARDGLIVLGGEMGAWEDHVAPWLPGVRDLLAGAVRDGLPVLGICLGAQLLAAACGGEVGRAADVPSAAAEIGVAEVSVRAGGDRLLGSLPATIPTTQWHLDMVTRLPAGAATLASSPACPVEAYRIGACAWGVQFHPEVRRAAFDAWNRAGAPALAARGLTSAAVLAGYDARAAEILRFGATIAASFAAVVTSDAEAATPVRAARG